MPYTNELCGLCRKLCCEYKTEEPLKKHTTFKIGGSCKILININSSDTLAEILKFLKKQNIRFFVLGTFLPTITALTVLYLKFQRISRILKKPEKLKFSVRPEHH